MKEYIICEKALAFETGLKRPECGLWVSYRDRAELVKALFEDALDLSHYPKSFLQEYHSNFFGYYPDAHLLKALFLKGPTLPFSFMKRLLGPSEHYARSIFNLYTFYASDQKEPIPHILDTLCEEVLAQVLTEHLFDPNAALKFAPRVTNFINRSPLGRYLEFPRLKLEGPILLDHKPLHPRVSKPQPSLMEVARLFGRIVARIGVSALALHELSSFYKLPIAQLLIKQFPMGDGSSLALSEEKTGGIQEITQQKFDKLPPKDQLAITLTRLFELHQRAYQDIDITPHSPQECSKAIKKITPFSLRGKTMNYRIGGIFYADSIEAARKGYLAFRALPQKMRQLLLSAHQGGVLLIFHSGTTVLDSKARGIWSCSTKNLLQDISIDARLPTNLLDGIFLAIATESGNPLQLIGTLAHEATHHRWFIRNYRLLLEVLQECAIPIKLGFSAGRLTDPFFFPTQVVDGARIARSSLDVYIQEVGRYLWTNHLSSAFDIPIRNRAENYLFARPLEYFSSNLSKMLSEIAGYKDSNKKIGLFEKMIRGIETRLYEGERLVISHFIKRIRIFYPSLSDFSIRNCIQMAAFIMRAEIGAFFSQVELTSLGIPRQLAPQTVHLLERLDNAKSVSLPSARTSPRSPQALAWKTAKLFEDQLLDSAESVPITRAPKPAPTVPQPLLFDDKAPCLVSLIPEASRAVYAVMPGSKAPVQIPLSSAGTQNPGASPSSSLTPFRYKKTIHCKGPVFTGGRYQWFEGDATIAYTRSASGQATILDFKMDGVYKRLPFRVAITTSQFWKTVGKIAGGVATVLNVYGHTAESRARRPDLSWVTHLYNGINITLAQGTFLATLVAVTGTSAILVPTQTLSLLGALPDLQQTFDDAWDEVDPKYLGQPLSDYDTARTGDAFGPELAQALPLHEYMVLNPENLYGYAWQGIGQGINKIYSWIKEGIFTLSLKAEPPQPLGLQLPDRLSDPRNEASLAKVSDGFSAPPRDVTHGLRDMKFGDGLTNYRHQRAWVDWDEKLLSLLGFHPEVLKILFPSTGDIPVYRDDWRFSMPPSKVMALPPPPPSFKPFSFGESLTKFLKDHVRVQTTPNGFSIQARFQLGERRAGGLAPAPFSAQEWEKERRDTQFQLSANKFKCTFKVNGYGFESQIRIRRGKAKVTITRGGTEYLTKEFEHHGSSDVLDWYYKEIFTEVAWKVKYGDYYTLAAAKKWDEAYKVLEKLKTEFNEGIDFTAIETTLQEYQKTSELSALLSTKDYSVDRARELLEELKACPSSDKTFCSKVEDILDFYSLIDNPDFDTAKAQSILDRLKTAEALDAKGILAMQRVIDSSAQSSVFYKQLNQALAKQDFEEARRLKQEFFASRDGLDLEESKIAQARERVETHILESESKSFHHTVQSSRLFSMILFGATEYGLNLTHSPEAQQVVKRIKEPTLLTLETVSRFYALQSSESQASLGENVIGNTSLAVNLMRLGQLLTKELVSALGYEHALDPRLMNKDLWHTAQLGLFLGSLVVSSSERLPRLLAFTTDVCLGVPWIAERLLTPKPYSALAYERFIAGKTLRQLKDNRNAFPFDKGLGNFLLSAPLPTYLFFQEFGGILMEWLKEGLSYVLPEATLQNWFKGLALESSVSTGASTIASTTVGNFLSVYFLLQAAELGVAACQTLWSSKQEWQQFCVDRKKASILSLFAKYSIAGVEIGQTPGDGNCLFNAIAYYTDYSHQELRRMSVEYARAHGQELLDLGLIENNDIETHLQTMARDKTWGTSAEIYCLAQRLNRPIIVILPAAVNLGLDHISPRMYELPGDPIFVCLQGNHYSGILLRGEPYFEADYARNLRRKLATLEMPAIESALTSVQEARAQTQTLLDTCKTQREGIASTLERIEKAAEGCVELAGRVQSRLGFFDSKSPSVRTVNGVDLAVNTGMTRKEEEAFATFLSTCNS